MNGNRGILSVMACESGKTFAERIMAELRQMARDDDTDIHSELRKTKEIVFPNGEIKTVIKENIRGDDLYIVQCMEDPLSKRSVNDNLLALLTSVHAGFQSDADHITVVAPQFPYSRQERRQGREAISAKLVAGMFELAGAQRVITLDIHAEAIQGFFNIGKLEDLHASNTIIKYVKNNLNINAERLVVTGPDVGSADKARHYSKKLGAELAIVYKAKTYEGIPKVEEMKLVGDVKNKDVLIVDDMISTGGTLLSAINLIRNKGGEKIHVATSLPFFNEKCIERLSKAYEDKLLEMVIGTDAVFHGEEFVNNTPWYREVSIAPLFANVIYNINKKHSVSELLK